MWVFRKELGMQKSTFGLNNCGMKDIEILVEMPNNEQVTKGFWHMIFVWAKWIEN
jgi:hypothetical protein